ncbi:MAG: general secretion pathway protein GspB [Candidatus Omnitrophota bacterium]
MDKEKRQQIILVIIIPVFFLGLIYMHSRQASAPGVPGSNEEMLKPDAGIDAIPMPDEGMDFSYTPGGENPFINLLQTHLASLNKKAPGENASLPMPPLLVEGMIWNTDNPQAIINGKVLNSGDIIDGVRIVNIEKQGITIDFNGEHVLIERKK